MDATHAEKDTVTTGPADVALARPVQEESRRSSGRNRRTSRIREVQTRPSLKKRVDDALQNRDAVLRSVAHDLRSPLNVIVLAASSLEVLARGVDAVDPAPLVAAIQRAAADMNRLIEDLIDVSRHQAGRLDLERASLRPADLVREIHEQFALKARTRAVTLIARIDGDLPAVWADAPRVARIFANLMDNALRFSDPGSTIEIEARRAEGGVEFAVIDHGPGVPPGDQASLFQPFWRGQPSHGSGSGLGLAIAKDIAEAHGGTLRFRPTWAGGSTFSFTLPAGAASHG